MTRRVFKTRTFGRWSRKARISDEVLSAAVEEMVRGLIDADLGGGVFKKRIPVPGRGKRGGARTIVGSNLQDRRFFLYGFEKKDRETIDMEPKSLATAVAGNELEEICHEEESPAQ